MSHCPELLGTADESIVKALVDAQVSMYTGLVGPGQGILRPWGYICVERVENQIDVLGLPWTMLLDTPSDSFSSVCSLMLPSDPTKVTPASTQSLLAKVALALTKVATADEKAAMDARVKVELLTAASQPSLMAGFGGVKREAATSSSDGPASKKAKPSGAVKV